LSILLVDDQHHVLRVAALVYKLMACAEHEIPAAVAE